MILFLEKFTFCFVLSAMTDGTATTKAGVVRFLLSSEITSQVSFQSSQTSRSPFLSLSLSLIRFGLLDDSVLSAVGMLAR